MNHFPNGLPQLDLLPWSHSNSGRRVWTLTRDLVYISPSEGEITCPAGTITDLGSIPRFAYNVISPSDVPEAFVVHDYTYHVRMFPRITCDRLLIEIMRLIGRSAIERRLVFWAVRLGGRGGYGKPQIYRVT